MEHGHERADVQSAGRDLPVRAVTVRGLAAARVDRRAADHPDGARAQCICPCARASALQRALMLMESTESPTMKNRPNVELMKAELTQPIADVLKEKVSIRTIGRATCRDKVCQYR